MVLWFQLKSRWKKSNSNVSQLANFKTYLVFVKPEHHDIESRFCNYSYDLTLFHRLPISSCSPCCHRDSSKHFKHIHHHSALSGGRRRMSSLQVSKSNRQCKCKYVHVQCCCCSFLSATSQSVVRLMCLLCLSTRQYFQWSLTHPKRHLSCQIIRS